MSSALPDSAARLTRVPASDHRAANGDDADLGSRLRAARQRKGISLAALAEQTGLTKGFLSQLERGLSRASVASLRRICAALEVPPSAMLDPLPEGPLATAGAPELHFGGQGARDRLLTPAAFPGFQVLHATVQPGGHNPGTGTSRPQESHFILVLRGSFVLELDGTAHRLHAGESLSFRGTDPYTWRNPDSDAPCEVLWVLSPPEI
jgi:transcriptional regulator with XRE-family HTH domain